MSIFEEYGAFKMYTPKPVLRLRFFNQIVMIISINNQFQSIKVL